MGRTRSRCRIVLGFGEQSPDPAAVSARQRYRSVYVRRESWRAAAAGEILLVFSHKNALVQEDEMTCFDESVPVDREIPELTLRVSGPLGAHDEAVFVRPPSARGLGGPHDGAAGAMLGPAAVTVSAAVTVAAVSAAVAAGEGVSLWESILRTAAERVAVPLEVRERERRVLVVTYCSRRKNEAAGDLPAIERYASPRLPLARDLAAALEADFRILSGRYGLLRAEDPIPYYDHLLEPGEVATMIERVTPGIGVYDEVIFAEVEGDYVEPYLAVIAGAASAAETRLRVETIG